MQESLSLIQARATINFPEGKNTPVMEVQTRNIKIAMSINNSLGGAINIIEDDRGKRYRVRWYGPNVLKIAQMLDYKFDKPSAQRGLEFIKMRRWYSVDEF